MGRNIGTLGQQRAALDLEFTYFGTTIRVHPAATDGVELEFLEAGRDIDVAELEAVDLSKIDAMDDEQQRRLFVTLSKASRAGYVAVLTALHRLIHPDDFEAYWKVGMDNGQQVRDRMADIRAITTAVIEATTDFPTGPPSASATGPATTSPPSEVASPSPGTPATPSRPVVQVPTTLDGAPIYTRRGTDLEVALALERGRPDLQEFYVMEAENREYEARQKREQDARDRTKLATAGLSAD